MSRTGVMALGAATVGLAGLVGVIVILRLALVTDR